MGGRAQKKAMRKVAGTLRIDLAQYQELASFAQFGSELDKESQFQLARGQRLTELLKQGQYKPMLVEEQTLVLFAGTKGYLDEIAINKVLTYQEELLNFARAKYSDLLKKIAQAKALDDELENEIKAVLEEFKTLFKGK